MDQPPVYTSRDASPRSATKHWEDWLGNPDASNYFTSPTSAPRAPQPAILLTGSRTEAVILADRAVGAARISAAREAQIAAFQASPMTGLVTLLDYARIYTGFPPAAGPDLWNGFFRYMAAIEGCPLIKIDALDRQNIWDTVDPNASIQDWVLSQQPFESSLAASIRNHLDRAYNSSQGATVRDQLFVQSVLIAEDVPTVEIAYVYSTREMDQFYKTSAMLCYLKVRLDDFFWSGVNVVERVMDTHLTLVSSWLEEH